MNYISNCMKELVFIHRGRRQDNPPQVITLNICITSTTKMLTVSLLVCAIMALTGAAAVPEGETDLNAGPEGNSNTAEVVPSCPGGWTGYNDRCFLYIPSLMSWANAEKHCQTQGGNLASVHSFDEQRAIQTMIQRQTFMYPRTWLGGYDAMQEGTWFWSDGTPFHFTYWAPGQPDNFLFAQHCLSMNYGDERKFDDHRCDFREPFVCAKKL
ncbi:galactose-specific lectin nattectin-like isoform X2 [Sparus aurata]|uniref:galactose-specific lectin nattectin-like isoform X2 n=1 Tax=Sparus aurata TaxID=8175 RepID=UPI0011C0D73F|nr:galactose-specific lectin nattectin-like isoform X2 [Sparus aurata]